MEKGVKSRLKSTEITIRERVECERKAFYIVNKLIDGCVDAEYLAECGERISQVNYDDIVEERAISMLCGYPICDKTLPNVPKKKYHISTKANKVYDITERKNFCCNQCFKASKFFREQIPESPVWARDGDVNITISPHKAVPGLVGDEVIGEKPNQILKEELEILQELDDKRELKQNSAKKNTIQRKSNERVEPKTNEMANISTEISSKSSDILKGFSKENTDIDRLHVDFDTLNLEDSEAGFNSSELCKGDRTHSIISSSAQITEDKVEVKKVLDKENKPQPPSKLQKLQELLNQRKNVLSKMLDLQDVAEVPADDTQHQKDHSHDLQQENPEVDNSVKVSQPDQSSIDSSVKSSQTVNKPSPLPSSPLQYIGQVMKTWSTSATVEFLQVKNSQSASEEHRSLRFSDPQMQVGYANLCKSLDHREKQFSNVLEEFDSEITKSTDDPKDLKTAPDYKALREEAEQFQLKVTEYITGKRPKDKAKEKQNDSSEDVVYLPTVDTYDQSQIRAKIVLERLDRSLSDVLAPMGLSIQDTCSHVRNLVYTFRLEKDTIIFRPAEWTLVSLILLKMLSFRLKAVDEAFKKDSAIQHFTVLLKGIRHTLGDLDNVTRDILSSESTTEIN